MGDGSGAPSAKIAEVQRLATALAARVRYAQLVGRPVYEAQISALVLPCHAISIGGSRHASAIIGGAWGTVFSDAALM